MIYLITILIISMFVSWIRVWNLHGRVHHIEGELYALKKKSGYELNGLEEEFLEKYPGFMM